jgi:hypothetical protein
MNNLIPLKVPSGWAVLYNQCFNNEDMIVLKGKIQNDISFKEDILSIAQVEYIDSEYRILNSGYWVDLGWYPDRDPSGQYRLVLFRDNWNNLLIEYRTKEKKKIQFAINKILDYCTTLKQEEEDKIIKKLSILLK